MRWCQVRRVVKGGDESVPKDRERESCKCGWCQSYYIKRKIKIKENSTIYGDVHKKNSIGSSHNLVLMHVLCWVMLNLFQLWPWLDFLLHDKINHCSSSKALLGPWNPLLFLLIANANKETKTKIREIKLSIIYRGFTVLGDWRSVLVQSLNTQT